MAHCVTSSERGEHIFRAGLHDMLDVASSLPSGGSEDSTSDLRTMKASRRRLSITTVSRLTCGGMQLI